MTQLFSRTHIGIDFSKISPLYTHIDEAMAHCQVVDLWYRSENLPKESNLVKIEDLRVNHEQSEAQID